MLLDKVKEIRIEIERLSKFAQHIVTDITKIKQTKYSGRGGDVAMLEDKLSETLSKIVVLSEEINRLMLDYNKK